MVKLPLLGVIEGFYGQPWSMAERIDMLGFLSEQGFQSYCYAPKADAALRKTWWQDWSACEFEQLLALRDKAAQQGIAFSIGLTPLDLHQQWGSGDSRRLLKKRLQQLRELQLDGISILFDDMWGDDAQLAQCQVDISHCIADELSIDNITVCPSYYSFDPILEELFGKKPDGYWQSLGQKMDGAIDIYWTGDKVISENYGIEGLEIISSYLQRKPVIWDNSRVSDGKKTSPYLPVKAMPDILSLHGLCSGFIANPMNAAALAQPVLKTLQLSGDLDARLNTALELLAPELSTAIQPLLALFNTVAVDELSAGDVHQLREFIQQYPHAYSENIARWLAGDYVFDPACLT